jgi:hypothetical protein
MDDSEQRRQGSDFVPNDSVEIIAAPLRTGPLPAPRPRIKMAFEHDDVYKPLPCYQVMVVNHFHSHLNEELISPSIGKCTLPFAEPVGFPCLPEAGYSLHLTPWGILLCETPCVAFLRC